MGDALRHRGPDADGTWVDGEAGVALAHRRLSILDVSPLGAQPMLSKAGRYVTVYNGEVYNFAELRDELAQRGATFRGGSDTEVILAAIEAWGIEPAISRLAGMFAVAVWDKELRRLHLARDRLGIKPLYWGQFGQMFLFGSELKALLACPGWTAEVDRNALASYARWNYVPSPQSIYRGVAKLAPGTMLTIEWPGGVPVIRTYWNFLADVRAGKYETEDIADEEAAAALDAQLRLVVGQHMASDVPLGAFLSGGVDSSLILALMQAQSARPVRSFTIGFRENGYDEAKYAAAVARHLGTDHTELYVGPTDALALVPHLADHYDEPFADSSQVPTFLVSQMTRKHVTVALSGDGGDELFAGYTRYRWAELVRRWFLPLPAAARDVIARLLEGTAPAWEGAGSFAPERWRVPRLGERAVKLARFLREPDADAVYRRQHTHWPAPDEIIVGGRELRGLPFDATLARDVPEFVTRMQLLDLLTYLPDDILTKVDRASMAVSLEVRVPLLDHRIVETTWRLPQRMKLRGGTSKWLLRQVLYRYVPRHLMKRPKMGFSVPIAQWLRGPLREWAEALLTSRRLDQSALFRASPVRAAWDGLLAGSNIDQEPLWGVLMFEAWRDRYGAVHPGQVDIPGTRPA